jgi:hypothetical protein
MRPWMGARTLSALVATATLALAVAPSLAAADDGVTLTRFRLPDRAAVDTLNHLGADLAENVIPGADGTVYVDATVTPEEKAVYQAMGFVPVETLSNDATVAAVRAERNAALADEAAARANLKAGHAVTKAQGKSLAADTVEATRADYFTNYAGRFVSVEGWTNAGGATGNGSYSGPALVVDILDGSSNIVRSGDLQPFVDDGKYLYHRDLLRVGDLNDGGGMPATVRVASANGGVATLAVKRWVSDGGSGQFPGGFLKDFNNHYVDPQEAYGRIRALATEFPNISQVYDLPNKTNGYQRKSMAIVGTQTAYTNGTSNLATAEAARAVQVTSKLYGQDGGNSQSIQLANPGQPSQALGVSVNGNAVTVNLATDAAGTVTSTAAQVVAAINANAAASALMTAATYHANANTSVVTPTATTLLRDFLSTDTPAAANYPRGPQTVQMLRIGAHRDGSKVGVFLYCQEHAREWATSQVCLETAERLLRNYATDPETKSLVDNLDIFIVPVVNADGTAFSLYDFASQRKNMTNYCPAATDAATNRNAWGVDVNRNFSQGSLFDGYDGASTSCTSEVFAGPGEFSEPESRNEQWIQNTFPNIKFANNIHSYGGYFMWPPGAYIANGRILLPYASPGVNQYFDQTAAKVLDRIKSFRGTAVLPARTGPVADVLYSAAGNSADEAYYSHGIIGYDFEVGVDRFVDGTLSVASAAGATGIRVVDRTAFQRGDKITIDGGTANEETATVASVAASNPASPNPNVTLTAALTKAHTQGAFVHGGATQSAVNFQPAYATEGHEEGMEFANGNYALLGAAVEYQNDTTAPVVTVNGPDISPTPYDVTFNQSEAADIWYTTDGSAPTTSSTVYGPVHARALPVPIHVGGTLTLRWLAKDFKGNTSTGSKTLYIGTQANGNVGGSTPATLALSLGTPASFGAFTPGVGKDYEATMTATVISTAGDGALSVADPSSTATGHLVNGTFSLPSVLQTKATSAAGTGSAYAGVGGSANPTTVLTYGGPTSNDAVSLGFKQTIGANDALRTGSYSKTLTFTLSTTNP